MMTILAVLDGTRVIFSRGLLQR